MWGPAADWKFLADAEVAAGKRRRCVLVIEDDIALQTVMTRILRTIDREADVRWATTGDEALNTLRERARMRGQPFDLVIADISLPGKHSGLDVWDSCQQEFPDMPFMFVSGMPIDRFLRSIGRNEICPPYVAKPIFTGECRQVIRSLLK